MPTFNFITSDQFRTSLENDYAELNRSLESKSWKSVQILAGSIVEALLIDYISASNTKVPSGKDVLKIDLADAVSICKNENIISQRTADLCSVIRSYRNLIHPARQIRLEEISPSQQSANIAASLVDLIIEEIIKARKKSFGLTAEQIVSKLENDHNSTALLLHLLKEVHETEIERLLLTILPNRYILLASQNNDYPDTDNVDSMIRLEKGFRISFDYTSNSIKTKVVAKFVNILKNEEGYQLDLYADAFFKPRDIKYLEKKNIPIVKEFYLSKLPSSQTKSTLENATELVTVLENNDELGKWIDSFVRALISTSIDESEKTDIRSALITADWQLSKEQNANLDKRLDDWVAHFKRNNQESKSEYISNLKKEIEENRPPW